MPVLIVYIYLHKSLKIRHYHSCLPNANVWRKCYKSKIRLTFILLPRASGSGLLWVRSSRRTQVKSAFCPSTRHSAWLIVGPQQIFVEWPKMGRSRLRLKSWESWWIWKLEVDTPEPVYLCCRHHQSQLLRSATRMEGLDPDKPPSDLTGGYQASGLQDGEWQGFLWKLMGNLLPKGAYLLCDLWLWHGLVRTIRGETGEWWFFENP